MKTIKSLIKGNKGISEVMGALLLVAVAIIAVSGIAVIVADVQKSEMERQSNVEAVEKENLKIMSVNIRVNSSKGLLDNADITVANLNSQDSRISAILVNDRYSNNYTSTDDYNARKSFNYTDRLRIPAGRNKVLSVNFTENYELGYNVSASESLEITIVSENANTFSRMYQPPTPVIKTSIETEDLGVAERDLLVLDGSDSYDDGSILSYVWKLYSYNGTDYNMTAQYSGRKAKATVNQTSDIYFDLTVQDDNGMIGISGKIKIPYSPNFNPAARVNTSKPSYTGTENIKVSVYDVYGRPLENATVLFIGMIGNVTVSPTSDLTDAAGLASTWITGGAGTVEIKVGKIEKYVSVE
ncbi:MAG: type IV pilin [Candidatus Altiarchaeia archaeon]